MMPMELEDRRVWHPPGDAFLLGSLPLVVLYTYVGSAFTVVMLAWNRQLARKRLAEPPTEPCEEGR